MGQQRDDPSAQWISRQTRKITACPCRSADLSAWLTPLYQCASGADGEVDVPVGVLGLEESRTQRCQLLHTFTVCRRQPRG